MRKKSFGKKMVSLVLSFAMVCTMFTVDVQAQEPDSAEAGIVEEGTTEAITEEIVEEPTTESREIPTEEMQNEESTEEVTTETLAEDSSEEATTEVDLPEYIQEQYPELEDVEWMRLTPEEISVDSPDLEGGKTLDTIEWTIVDTYAQLNKAMKDSTTQYIRLGSDITVGGEGSLLIGRDEPVSKVLDLCGRTLMFQREYMDCIIIENESHLIVLDCDPDEHGTIRAHCEFGDTAAKYTFAHAYSLIMKEVNIFKVRDTAKLTIMNGNFEAGKAWSKWIANGWNGGSGMYNGYANIIHGGSVLNASSGSTVEINGGTFSGRGYWPFEILGTAEDGDSYIICHSETQQYGAYNGRKGILEVDAGTKLTINGGMFIGKSGASVIENANSYMLNIKVNAANMKLEKDKHEYISGKSPAYYKTCTGIVSDGSYGYIAESLLNLRNGKISEYETKFPTHEDVVISGVKYGESGNKKETVLISKNFAPPKSYDSNEDIILAGTDMKMEHMIYRMGMKNVTLEVDRESGQSYFEDGEFDYLNPIIEKHKNKQYAFTFIKLKPDGKIAGEVALVETGYSSVSVSYLETSHPGFLEPGYRYLLIPAYTQYRGNICAVNFAKTVDISVVSGYEIASAGAYCEKPKGGRYPYQFATVSEYNGHYTTSLYGWYDRTDGNKELDPIQDTFAPGHDFTLRVEYDADSSYKFTDETVFTINGEKPDKVSMSEDRSVAVAEKNYTTAPFLNHSYMSEVSGPSTDMELLLADNVTELRLEFYGKVDDYGLGWWDVDTIGVPLKDNTVTLCADINQLNPYLDNPVPYDSHKVAMEGGVRYRFVCKATVNGTSRTYYDEPFEIYFNNKKAGTKLRKISATVTEPTPFVDFEYWIKSDNPSAYEITDVEWYLDEAPNYPKMEANVNVAQPGKTYNVRYMVQLKDGYAFAADCHFLLNGEETNSFTGDGSGREYSFDVPACNLFAKVPVGDLYVEGETFILEDWGVTDPVPQEQVEVLVNQGADKWSCLVGDPITITKDDQSDRTEVVLSYEASDGAVYTSPAFTIIWNNGSVPDNRETIGFVGIKDVVEPAAGATPRNTVTVNSFECKAVSDLQWKCLQDDSLISPENLTDFTGKFQNDKYYLSCIELEANEGYRFEEGMTYVYINDKECEILEFAEDRILVGCLFAPIDAITPLVSSLTVGNGNITVKWAKLPNVSQYRVFYKDDKGQWQKIGDTTGNSMLFSRLVDGTALANGKKYNFTVRGLDKDGKYCTAHDPAGKTVTYYKPPVIKSLTDVKTGINVIWENVPGVSNYRVFRKGGEDTTWIKVGDIKGTGCTDTNVKKGVTYTYTVRCLSEDGNAYISSYDPNGKSLTFTQTLNTPKITGADNMGTKVRITWNEVMGAGKYRIFRKGDGVTTWTRIGDTSDLSFEDPNVKVGVTYTYTVRCISSDLKTFTSNYDPTGKSVTFTGKLNTPKITGADNVMTGIQLTWGAVPGAAKYRVFRKGGGVTSWTKIADVTDATYKDEDVTVGVAYTYTVRCLSADGKTFTSNFDSTGKTVTFTGKLNTPQISSIKNETTGIKITWGAVPGATKYRVFRKGGSVTSWTKVEDVTGTSYTDTNVEKGVTYSYTVRCLSADGKSFISNFDPTGKSMTR